MSRDAIYQQAIDRCRVLFDRAQELGLKNPLAAALGTTDAEGRPSVRIVLLRGFDERGFVFYTNSESRKGAELAENPRAALCFYWETLYEQLRVEGNIEKVDDEESDAYWSTRSRSSQLAARASKQSGVLDDRKTYEDLVAGMDREFAGRNVPRPDYWFGYRIVPDRIEFWLARDARMHDRTVYEMTAQGWKTYLLYP